MKIGTHPEPSPQQTEKMNWANRQRVKRELRKLSREIEAVRALLSEKYEQTPDMQSPTIRLVSTHLDTLIVRYQRLNVEMIDKPPPQRAAVPPPPLLSSLDCSLFFIPYSHADGGVEKFRDCAPKRRTHPTRV